MSKGSREKDNILAVLALEVIAVCRRGYLVSTVSDLS